MPVTSVNHIIFEWCRKLLKLSLNSCLNFQSKGAYVVNVFYRPEFLMDTNRTLPMNRQGEVSNFTNVEGWLISIKMEKYMDNFLNCGYRTIEQVLKITQQDLEQRVGVTLIGHQKKIMNSIQTLRAQRFGQFPQVSEGFLV